MINTPENRLELMRNDKYQSLIDAETWTFIERSNAAFPDNATQLSMHEQRALYDNMCKAFQADYPDDVISYDSQVRAANSSCVNTRHYENIKTQRNPHAIQPVQIIYLHGGGFVVGGLESHDDICAEICKHTGYRVTAVDYRLSPEHKHPTALDDVMLVINHCWRKYQQSILLCGDSAGANLAAASCHSFRNMKKAGFFNAPQIIAQVLIYAALGGDTSKGSYIEHADAPMLSTVAMGFYNDMRRGHPDDDSDPTFAPLTDTDFAQLPATVAISAQCDPVCDDSRHYCKCITDSGGNAHWLNEAGLVHGYLRARHSVQRAALSFTRIIDVINTLAEGRWPPVLVKNAVCGNSRPER